MEHTEHHNHESKYASFWTRLVAFIIDGIIVGVILFILLFLVIGVPNYSPMMYGGMWNNFHGGLYALISALVALLWSALFESSKLQATPGKMLFKLKVTDMNGNRITQRAALARALAKVIASNNPIIPYILYFFTEKKQVAHDIIAKTLVVKK
jgi:uncharacterized RDD family membrane protein YckC